MYSFGLPLLLLSLLALTHGSTLPGTIDTGRLETILLEGLKSNDISTLYFSLKGLKDLKSKALEKLDICKTFKALKYDLKNGEQIFHLTNAASLSGCVNSLNPDVLGTASRALDNPAPSVQDLYHAIYTLKALGKGQTMNKDEALKNIVTLLKKDDTPQNYAYVFALCEHMGCESWTGSHAEGVILSADESDSKALFFEGGLPVTSLLLSSVIRSYKVLKKPAPLTEEQRYKFAAYLWSRRSVTSPRGAALLLDAAVALADDEPAPIAILTKGRKYITSEQDTIEITVSDLLGRPLRSPKADEVVAQSGTRLADDVVVLSKQPLTKKPNDPTTFVLNLSKIKSQYGVYKIALSAGSKTTTVNVAVLGDIQVSSVEIGVGDVDGTTSPKVTTVAYPNKLTEKLQADQMQKLSLKFTVRDKAGKAVLVQQAFVRLSNDNDDEAIFVAEPDNAKTYKVELNIGAIAKHLRRRSGAHAVTLYLGDGAAAAPLAWPLGEVALSFGKDASAVGEPVKTTTKPHRGPLPEITHVFRSPEPRPPRLFSDVFACACAAPLLLLLVLWAKLRVNLSNMPLAPSALVFHLALGGSLGLYGVLWLQLSMFETVRYLLPLGALTFLSGHRLLRRLVKDKASR